MILYIILHLYCKNQLVTSYVQVIANTLSLKGKLCKLNQLSILNKGKQKFMLDDIMHNWIAVRWRKMDVLAIRW